MPIVVTLRESAAHNGERCAFFDRVWWWPVVDLMGDSRFRVLDRASYYGVACLSTEEIRELQDRFRSNHGPHKRESDRLDCSLVEGGARWWVISVYEWESGYD